MCFLNIPVDFTQKRKKITRIHLNQITLSKLIISLFILLETIRSIVNLHSKLPDCQPHI